MKRYLTKNIVQHSLLKSTIIKKNKQDWIIPSNWKSQNINLRKTAPENSIALLAGVKSDYSAYDNLGFVAQCTGGYNVFIDGVQYGETYASATQCNITWSNYSATQGKNITTPENLIAHEIHIVPANTSDNITVFHCARVADTGTEYQGVLWTHFNLENICETSRCIRDGAYGATYTNYLILAITARNNILNTSGYQNFSNLPDNGKKLQYLPKIKWASGNLQVFCPGAQIKELVIVTDMTHITFSDYCFAQCTKLRQIKINKPLIAGSNMSQVFFQNYKLKKLPNIDYTNATNMSEFLVDAESLQDTILDMRSATGLKIIGCYGSTTHFMTGFKGLRVSNQAPFDATTSPQINVSYTGMDRQALVQLFNDLPSVSGTQIIKITGCTGTANLTAEDEAIATEKGWTIME